MDEPRTVAAVDLGSNSFHMIVARWSEGQLHVVDKLRERVALAEGFDSRRNLRAEAWERALECLGRFGERLHGLPVDSVRAVGTYTLRRARNAREFLTEAEAALGHSIEIVAGHEEARLIYLGAAEALGFDEKRRLVVDIGGGSTEFILGEGRVPLERDSVSMGCVRFGLKYFGDRKIRRSTFEDARIAGRIQMRSFERRYRGHRF
jgi:exopolyphosphatase/guanosine-5'-triphosphate,3'-diphosphate pyrophosphatase